MEGRIQKMCLAGTRTEARAASRTFMAPEYRSTSRKDTTPLSTNSAVISS